MSRSLFKITLLLPLFTAGCSWQNPIASLSPHHVEIRQGNHVTQEMLAKLKPGMSRAQVRFVLGTPLIVDPFRNDRWEYVTTLKQDGRFVERRHITVVFDQDVLKGIEGDVTAAPQRDAVQETPASEVKP